MKQCLWTKTPERLVLLSILQPTYSLCHERHQGINQHPSGSCSRDVLCRLLPPQLHFQSGPEPSSQIRMPSPSVVSHRGVCLQLTEVNLALTLPVVSVQLACSRWCCPTPDMTCLLYFPFFTAGSGNTYSINIYKKLKISLLFCHKLILLCL